MNIEIITRFLNSMHFREFYPSEDLLLGRDWRERFVRKFEITAEAHDSSVIELTALRTAGRAVLEALLDGNEPSSEDVACMNAFLPKTPSRLHWEEKNGSQKFVLKNKENMRLVEFLAMKLAGHFSSPDFRKLKLCANPKCRWVFHDTSRNQSRRWCSSAHCGNVSKVRAFRERNEK